MANPYGEPGDRMYRTGDVVRWTKDADGALTVDYVGRSDQQVKVRGFRIELGEIDAVLAKHPAVDFATTSVLPGPSGDSVLVSYVLPAPGAEVDVAAILDFVGEFVPTYMVPSTIVTLDAIPLTPVGKLDRRALPEPEFLAEDREFRAAGTALEQRSPRCSRRCSVSTRSAPTTPSSRSAATRSPPPA